MTTQRNNNDKLKKAIEATEEYIKNCEKKGNTKKFTDNYGLTIYGCEVRNLREYREIEKVKDKRTLKGRLKELYLSI